MRLSGTFHDYTGMFDVKVPAKLTFPASAARTDRVQAKAARHITSEQGGVTC